MKTILCLCICVIAGISITAQRSETAGENAVLFRNDCWSFRDSLFKKMSIPLSRYSKPFSPNKKLHDLSLSCRFFSIQQDFPPKKVPGYLSRYTLLTQLPYNSAVIDGSKSFFYPLQHRNFRESFLTNEKWKDVTRWVGYNILSNIGDNYNFIYTFPK